MIRLLLVPFGAALLVAAASAVTAAQVVIVSPSGQNPVFDQVAFAVEVIGAEAIGRVELFVDGRRVAELTAPPYRVTVDVGAHNREHRFRAVAHMASGATAADAVETPAIKVDDAAVYDLQQLYVTATKDAGRVLDISRSEFSVRDQGRRQEIVTFERGQVPFTAVILLDSSASMRGAKLEAALSGARAFAAGMRPLDEAMLLAFSDRRLAQSPFVGPGEELLGNAAGLEARGGTALNDHLYAALKQIEDRQGRRVVILLTDGMDSHSVLTIDDVLPQASRSRALVYWVRLGAAAADGRADRDPGLQHSPWRDGKAHRRQVEGIEEAVLRSGGRVVPVSVPEEIGPAFAEILAELREQYVISYYPSIDRSDGSWHDVTVDLTRRGIDLRYARGYFDD